MEWLWVLAAALASWLGCVLFQACRAVVKGRGDPEGTVFLLMGNQAEVAEWFLRMVYRSEGILTGRLALAVGAEGRADDTARIVEIMSRQKGFRLVGPGEGPGSGPGQPERIWFIDVRGMNTRDLLKGPLNVLAAL